MDVEHAALSDEYEDADPNHIFDFFAPQGVGSTRVTATWLSRVVQDILAGNEQSLAEGRGTTVPQYLRPILTPRGCAALLPTVDVEFYGDPPPRGTPERGRFVAGLIMMASGSTQYSPLCDGCQSGGLFRDCCRLVISGRFMFNNRCISCFVRDVDCSCEGAYSAGDTLDEPIEIHSDDD